MCQIWLKMINNWTVYWNAFKWAPTYTHTHTIPNSICLLYSLQFPCSFVSWYQTRLRKHFWMVFFSMAVSFLKVFYDDFIYYCNIIKKIIILWAYSLIYIAKWNFFITIKRQSRKRRLQTIHETPVSSTKKRMQYLFDRINHSY